MTSSYLRGRLRSEARARLERDLLAVGLIDETRLNHICDAALNLQIVASLAAARIDEIETGEYAAEFAKGLDDLIADILLPGINVAKRIAREREEEEEEEEGRDPPCGP